MYFQKCISKCVFIFKCIFPKCIYPKCIFAKCTRLACLLSFASLFLTSSTVSSFSSPPCFSAPFSLPCPDFFPSLSSFADLLSLILLPQLIQLLLNPIRNFSFLGAFMPVPFFAAINRNNSTTSTFLQMLTSKDA